MMIVDCSNDELVNSRIREEYESLEHAGYALIIGIFGAIDDQNIVEVKQMGEIGGGDDTRIVKIIKHVLAALFGVIRVKGAICRTT